MDWEFQTNHEIIVRARRNATGPVWDYLAGGSETETSMRRNRQALDSLAFIPRVLRDVSDIDLSTTILKLGRIYYTEYTLIVESLSSFH